MNKRDILLPTLSTFAIGAMMIFISCASHNQVKDQGDGTSNAVAAAQDGATDPNDDMEALAGDAKDGAATADSAAPKADGANPPAGGQAKAADGGDDLGIPADGAATADNAAAPDAQTDANAEPQNLEAAADKPEANAQATPPPADADASAAQPADAPKNAGAEADSTATPPADAAANADAESLGADTGGDSAKGADAGQAQAANAPPPSDQTQTPPTTDQPSAANQSPDQQQQDQQAATEPVQNSAQPAKEEPAAPTTPATAPQPSAKLAGSGKVSRAPKIPGTAIHRHGTLLNRFYFARKGDSPKKVSLLIYGSPAQAQSLTKWNRGKWKPGKLIFYVSPVQAQDTQMHSFYQERNVSPEEYQVKRGDWLSRIAAKRLGSARSWKEIAVVNGIESPDAIEPGQKLAIYPLDLSYSEAGASTTAQSDGADQVAKSDMTAAQNTAPAAPPPQAQPPQPPPVQTPAQAAQAPQAGIGSVPGAPDTVPSPEVSPPPPMAAEPPPIMRKPIRKAGELDTTRLLEQNLPFIVLAAGVIILLLALLAVNKRRRAKQADDGFNEDGFSSKAGRR